MAQNNQTGAGSGGQKSKFRTVSSPKLEDLIEEIDPQNKLDPSIKRALASLGEEFVDHVARGACLMAKSRKASTVEPRDIEYYLKRRLEMIEELSGNEEGQPEQPSKAAAANKARTPNRKEAEK